MTAPVLAAVDPVTLDPAPLALGALLAGAMGAPLIGASVVAAGDDVEALAAAQSGETLAPDPGAALDELAGGEVVRLTASSVPRALDIAAEELGAAALMAGSGTGAPPGRLAPGRTTERLLRGSRHPLALVAHGHEAQALSVIGAGFVDTAEGREAVRRGAELATRAGATLRVLAAVGPASSGVRARAEEAARDAVPASGGLRVDVDVLDTEPGDALTGLSTELDLLVCGARSYGTRPGVHLGGLTRRVAGEAACPVLLLA
jgi:nucleotide-binding universal stress UspA family protein